MRVRAIATGYYCQLREPGKDNAVFDIPDDMKLGSWMEKIDDAAQAAAAATSPLDHDGDGRPGGAAKQPPSEELTTLRTRLKELTGKTPFAGWSIDKLKEKIAALTKFT